jgi:hypothetical protein
MTEWEVEVEDGGTANNLAYLPHKPNILKGGANGITRQKGVTRTKGICGVS